MEQKLLSDDQRTAIFVEMNAEKDPEKKKALQDRLSSDEKAKKEAAAKKKKAKKEAERAEKKAKKEVEVAEKKAKKQAAKQKEEAEWQEAKALRASNELKYKAEEQKAKAVHDASHPDKPELFLSLSHVNKIYSNRVQAVYDFNLDVKEGEFIVLVGPSGCGKSTTLRMVAGLEDVTTGELYISGRYANKLEPKERGVAMVFQSYALYPHLSVYENLAFGLYKLPKEEVHQRIERAAEILQISEYLDRKPTALSGGQCQRVALGRALVRNAKIFLLDEPLSNLDAKLRVQMRSELVALHDELRNTMLYVTHDQTEAMTMADRIVVMNRGHIQQVGTPLEVYEKPANLFVATFIGSPTMNVIDAYYEKGAIVLEKEKIVLTKEEQARYEGFYESAIEKEDDPVKKAALMAVKEAPRRKVIFGIRPEDINAGLTKEKDYGEPILESIDVAELLGAEYFLHYKHEEGGYVAKVPAERLYKAGDKVVLRLRTDKIHLFDPTTKLRIL